MKRCFCVILALLCVISATAFAEGKLTVSQKSLFELDADDSGYFYAKIENTGDAPIGVGYGKLVAFSANDDILISKDYVSTYPSNIVLNPGEYAYARESLWESMLESNDIADYKFSIAASDYASEVDRLPCTVEFSTLDENSYDNYVYVTFTNTGESILYGCYITAALFDADGNLLYVDGNSYDSMGVHPGSTVTLKLYVNNDLVAYFARHSLKADKADAVVFVYRKE
jgi:hypothetical protein